LLPKLPGSELDFRVRLAPWPRRSGGLLPSPRHPLPLLVALLVALRLAGCAGGPRPAPPQHPEEAPRVGFEQRGLASWYGPGFDGRATASGEIYDMEAMTAAHRTLAFGSVVEVRNLDNGRVARVRINDRGPFVHGRIIDLSRAAARELGVLVPGTAEVRIRVVGWRGARELPAPRVAAVAPAEPAGSWWVQVGAFLDASRARAQAERMRRYGETRVSEAGGWHRVLLGPYRGRQAADQMAATLLEDGFDVVLRPVD
jgi:peptidoglycan lytic transglycosylase